MSDPSSISALWRAPLNGSLPVYYVYVDEAGTSAKEPVTVVAGVILHADRDWMRASRLIQKILDDRVPEDLREGFIFHAKAVLSGYRGHDSTWSREDRMDLIGAMAGIPKELGAAISVGVVRRTWNLEVPEIKKMTRSDHHHIYAFFTCISRANKWIGDWAEKDEIGTVIAEDVSQNKRFLRAALKYVPPVYPQRPPYVQLTKYELDNNVFVQTNTGPIDRLVDAVLFATKDEGVLLQIADACAFSFRRYFAEQEWGEKLIRSMLLEELAREDWTGEIHDVVFNLNPRRRYFGMPTRHSG